MHTSELKQLEGIDIVNMPEGKQIRHLQRGEYITHPTKPERSILGPAIVTVIKYPDGGIDVCVE